MLPEAPNVNLDDNAKASPNQTAPTQIKILEPETIALQRCLKDIVIKTGQMYSFYADTRRLGIAKHAPKPPQSLTTALGRDIERYDQLCDAIEARLLRAINVLKRDLLREEKRIMKIEERRRHSDTLMLPPSLPMTSEIRPEGSTIQPPIDGTLTYLKDSPIINTITGRRASAISISSLHRPQFPLKLDLSSTSLRITEEEAAIFTKGLASPVTLAPKSARLGPNEFPPEFMAAFANSSVPSDAAPEPSTMDLTLPIPLHVPQEQDGSTMNNGVGDSSDKPIELDLDIEMANMTDLFGDPDPEDSNINDGLFSPVLTEGESEQPQAENFVNFAANPDLVSQLAITEPSILQSDSTSVPSPGSLLAQFPRMMDHKPSPSDNATIPSMTETFDISTIDLSNLPTGFFSNTQDSGVSFPMDMEAFLTLGTGGEEKGEGENQSAT
ncbi:hypothetical protein BYT27DRAFT_7189712 [Phlegmacium glaucopus]|nr:hypothetical protein BYT27DRAFT_7189712 [Phlegmacium glaucopus]